MNDKITRRSLVKSAAVLSFVFPATGILFSGTANAQVPPLDPSEVTAKALGYVTKSPKPESKCDNCTQFQGKAGDAQGPCTIFPGKSVAAAGWCMSWAKKPA